VPSTHKIFESARIAQTVADGSVSPRTAAIGSQLCLSADVDGVALCDCSLRVVIDEFAVWRQ
jgi:hypothetical protein